MAISIEFGSLHYWYENQLCCYQWLFSNNMLYRRYINITECMFNRCFYMTFFLGFLSLIFFLIFQIQLEQHYRISPISPISQCQQTSPYQQQCPSPTFPCPHKLSLAPQLVGSLLPHPWGSPHRWPLILFRCLHQFLVTLLTLPMWAMRGAPKVRLLHQNLWQLPHSSVLQSRTSVFHLILSFQ